MSRLCFSVLIQSIIYFLNCSFCCYSGFQTYHICVHMLPCFLYLLFSLIWKDEAEKSKFSNKTWWLIFQWKNILIFVSWLCRWWIPCLNSSWTKTDSPHGNIQTNHIPPHLHVWHIVRLLLYYATSIHQS